MRPVPTSVLLVGAFLGLHPSLALAWPEEDQWAPLYHGGSVFTDVSGDAMNGTRTDGLDLVGDESMAPLAWWYADFESWYFRMRVNQDPSSLSTGTWSILILADADEDCWTYAIQASLDTSVWNVTLEENALCDGTPDAAETTLADLWGASDVRIESAASTLGGSADAFVSVAFPLSTFYASTGLTAIAWVKVAMGTSDGARSVPDGDLACTSDEGGLGELSAAWSDLFGIDEDGDSINFFDEVAMGCDPMSSDTDGDDLSDPNELMFGTQCDKADTDEDGVSDGQEAACGGDNSDDRDGDTLPDEVEGLTQSDGDGDADFCDTDSDGDGKPDGTEGLTDTDCDDLPNYRDPDDGDGSCDEPDTGETGETDTPQDTAQEDTAREDTAREDTAQEDTAQEDTASTDRRPPDGEDTVDGGFLIGWGACSQVGPGPGGPALLLGLLALLARRGKRGVSPPRA